MNDKQKLIAGYCVLVVGILGLGVLHYLKLRDRSRMQDEISRYSQQASDAQQKITRIPELRSEREKLISVIDEYMEILPKEEHVQHDAFVDIIDTYRRDTDIVIQKAEYVPIKEKKEARTGPDPVTVQEKAFFRHRYRFKLLGTVPELIEFVNKIENHTRFLKIDAINIKPLGAADSDGRGGSEDQEEEELLLAAEPVKEIELTVSTYTYYKGPEQKMKS